MAQAHVAQPFFKPVGPASVDVQILQEGQLRALAPLPQADRQRPAHQPHVIAIRGDHIVTQRCQFLFQSAQRGAQAGARLGWP